MPDVYAFKFYVEAFNELGTCRSIGMGLGPIPWTAIIEYVKIYQIDDLEEFAFIMRSMDRAFLDFESEKQKRANDNASKKNRNKSIK